MTSFVAPYRGETLGTTTKVVAVSAEAESVHALAARTPTERGDEQPDTAFCNR